MTEFTVCELSSLASLTGAEAAAYEQLKAGQVEILAVRKWDDGIVPSAFFVANDGKIYEYTGLRGQGNVFVQSTKNDDKGRAMLKRNYDRHEFTY